MRGPRNGYNNGKYNVGRYSKRVEVIDLVANVSQSTELRVVFETLLADLSASIHQRTPTIINVVAIPTRDIKLRIIQTEETAIEWDVNPPFEAATHVNQRTVSNIGVNYYVGIVYLGAKIAQKTPFKARATFVQGLSANVAQRTVVSTLLTPCAVHDFVAPVVQHTIFVPGANAGWSPWYPINPDYPAPWNDGPVREAA